MEYTVIPISVNDKGHIKQVETFLHKEGILRDTHIDYTCGIYDEQDNLIATGSAFGNTLRCLAVSELYQGEGLMGQIMSHLMEYQALHGQTHIFLYTKPKMSALLQSMGFYTISMVEQKLVFMENRRCGFENFCKDLKSKMPNEKNVAAIVMNANPFTYGHLHLVEQAAKENDAVHLFVLSENYGPIPFNVRYQLVKEATANISNVYVHPSGPYMISTATFPSYFLKDKKNTIITQARLDVDIFCKISQILNIQKRYVGEEPFSTVTAMYNNVMAQMLPKFGIDFVIIPRKKYEEHQISASAVRLAIHNDKLNDIKSLVPPTTYEFFAGSQGIQICERLKRMTPNNIIHY